MKTLSLLFAMLLALAPSARGQAVTDLASGARVWADNCTRCHNARSPMERNDRQWTTIGLHMRARANLTKTETQQVIAYLQAVNLTEPSVAPTQRVVVDKTIRDKPETDKKAGGGGKARPDSR